MDGNETGSGRKAVRFEMATAHSRMSKHWKTRLWTWPELVERCSRTTRTAETVTEYARMTKEEQAVVKDVGGFVGARLAGNVRRKGAVLQRTLVTLDLDYAVPGVWDDFTLNYGCAAMAYSTHKHTPDKPRLRLVIPVSRPMLPTEYAPVCRRIADTVGIDMFDQTSYEPERLMYWPSTPKDGEYFFRVQQGAPLDVDAVLASYADWHDASEWPTAAREWQRVPKVTDEARREMEKAGDPTLKPGAVGAFCRTYGIKAAMEKFLPGVYKPAGPGRYTYTGGHTSAGVVCYEDKWIYSHHDTDPCSKQLVNAFDMVRLHLYGLQDAGSRAQAVTKLPSYDRMVRMATDDPDVKRLMLRERREAAASDFDGLQAYKDKDPENGPDAGEPDDAWKCGLEMVRNSDRAQSTIANAELVLSNDPDVGGRLYYDLLRRNVCVEAPGFPWNRTAHAWDNGDESNMRGFLEKAYGIAGREKIRDAVEIVATRRQRHPIREYLQSLRWDGRPRVERLLVDYLGAEDSAYTRAITRIHLCAAVARVMTPGTKYDYCLMIAGPQGCGKSTLVAILGGEYYKDSLTSMDGKEAMEQVAGTWMIELSELSAMNRSEVNTIKQFITCRVDEFRPAFKPVKETVPRQCVFWGTTNDQHFLRDETGNRRFPVVPVDPSKAVKGPRWFDTLASERDQVWAEAYALWQGGERLYLPDDLQQTMADTQRSFEDSDDDPLMAALEVFVDTPLPVCWDSYNLGARRGYMMNATDDPMFRGTELRDRVCPAEFLCERMGLDMTSREFRPLARKVALHLRKMGWEGPRNSRHVMRLYGTQKTYFRPSEGNVESSLFDNVDKSEDDNL